MATAMFDGDTAVIGLGAMGSTALWRLAKRGLTAIGFDAGKPPHDRGSSHGETRMFRTAYYEHPQYVPLAIAALNLWDELERETRTHFTKTTGALTIGRADSKAVMGAVTSAEAYNLAYAQLTPTDVRARFPQHRVSDDQCGLLEAQGGYLSPEGAVAAALAAAQQLGALTRTNESVRSIEPRGSRWAVEGDDGLLALVDSVILCAGPWTNDFVPISELPLVVERQVAAWFPVERPELFDPDQFPVWIHELDGPRYRYGFPSLDRRTIKMAIHHEGRTIDPNRPEREVTANDLRPLQQFIEQHLHFVNAAPARTSVCMYTNSPDQHFVLGQLPGSPGLAIVAGCSGHAFKFAPILADAAVDLTTTGSTTHDISGFQTDRFTTHLTQT